MKKNTKIFALAGLGALVAVGGTFAYYNASQTFQNPFTTSNFGTYATEKFTIEDGADWQPGAEVDKEVYATNTGDGNVWVRVKFNESWKRGTTELISFDSHDGKFNTTGTTAGDYQVDVDTEDGKAGFEDGKIDKAKGEGSVVYKKFENVVDAAGKTTPQKWYYNTADGYYYYTSALVKGEDTVKLLDSVTLCEDTDMGRFDNNSFYTITDINAAKPAFDRTTWKSGECDFDPSLKGKTDDPKYAEKYAPYIDKAVWTYKENKLDENNQGYANAGYELDITVEFVQADEEASQAFPTEDKKWAWYPGKQ